MSEINSTTLTIRKDEGVDHDNEGSDTAENVPKLENLLVGDNHEILLKKFRDRFDKVDVQVPTVEVRYENLSVESEYSVGSEARPTLLNATKNFMQAVITMLCPVRWRKKTRKILYSVSGIVRPSRMTLLLGPPSSGKTTFLLALAGMLDNSDLKVTGKITYCGHELNELVPKRTCAYITQYDLHHGAMTVRETLDFSRRCLRDATRCQLLNRLVKREKELGINPNQENEFFMNLATTIKDTSFVTDYLLKILGLDLCADTIVGDDMRRGISGGEKKRLTIGEMLAGPARVLLMDEISTGLDSSTAFRICKTISDMVHIMDMTTIISLLQPTPEIYKLFDDIILFSDGRIIYQGPCDQILEFFEYVGFKCPNRKEIPDFLQEVTSKNDQQQYWSNEQQPYRFFSTQDFVQAFQCFQVGQKLGLDLRIPYHKNEAHPLAFAKQNYGISNLEIFKVCFSREWLLMKYNIHVHIFKSVQVIIMGLVTLTAFFKTTMDHKTMVDGEKYIGSLFFSLTHFVLNGMAETTFTIIGLPVFYKQRDFLFYPAWAYGLPVWILSNLGSLLESGLWTCITYYSIGYAPAASRFFCQWLAFFSIHQMALSIFRFVSALGRTTVIANAVGMIILLFIFVLSGLIITRGDIGPWIIWAYYLSPMMYGQHALVINEFLDERWSIPNQDPRIHEATIGKAILASRDLFHYQCWYWISIGALLGFSVLYNILYIVALAYLNPINNTTIINHNDNKNQHKNALSTEPSVDDAKPTMIRAATKEMSLPFQRLSLTFNHINYYVDKPSGSLKKGDEGNRIHLLQDVSGFFKAGVLTALLGVTGAGKTTLMDVLAGKKTNGYIEGDISISGYPKRQETFARVFGYCEQIDIHSPYITVYESLLYSAWLRLSAEIDTTTRKMFVEEILSIMELESLRDVVIGLPRTNGLSSEQRKRLTIAIELVANPSILFMDEPTTGLDARAAAIVVRTIRNTVNCGRTIVCTIHQPSIKMFEAFDELLLMKRGGQIIYAGPLGDKSHKLITYFEAIPGVPKIKDGCNPATWVLDVTNSQAESQMDIDFAQHYVNSELYRRNQEIIEELSIVSANSKNLHFSTKHSQPFSIQLKACFWKQIRSYWQNPSYNAIRFLMTILIAGILGIIFWNKGRKIYTQQDIINLFGMMFSAILFLGGINALNVQALIASERTVYYREKAARMYSTLPFALALLGTEAMYLISTYFVYCVLLYSMIGFEWTIGKFFYFYYFILMCMTYSTTFGMMLIALTPRPEISAIFTTLFATLWYLFAGFFLPRMQIPIWWRWYYWASPVSWTIYGLLTSQVGDKNSLVEVPEVANMPLKIYIKETLGYDYDFLPYVIVAHLGWVFLFSFVFVIGIKFLNFQKR